MSIEITMPKLSDTMEEGTVLQWRIKEGDEVKQGDVIAEVETDKAAMEMEAFENGTVSELRVKQGETVPVGTVLAVLNGAGAKQEKGAGQREKKQEAATPPAQEKEGKEEKPEEARQEQQKTPTPAAEKKEEPSKAEQQTESKKEEHRPTRPAAVRPETASPAARKLAMEQGLELAKIRGTGPGGRIVLGDVEREQGSVRQQDFPKAEGRESGSEGPRLGRKSTTIRRVVAGKMVESWQ
jgi:pyruvate dehydrogenase E2 component (dihydrolipoamide acetyltransferase)